MSVSINVFKQLFFLFSFSFLVACGKNSSFVSEVEFETLTGPDLEVYADVKSVLDLGSTSVPSMDIPIRHEGRDLGRFISMTRLDGRSDILVRVNLTEAFQLSPGSPYLPNGTLLPIADLVYADSLVLIPVPRIHTNIYVAAVSGRLVIGFASLVKGLDRLSGQVGTVNVFPRFEFGRVLGIAGIFTGSGPSESGLALFAAMQDIFPLQVEALVYDPNLTHDEFLNLYDRVENPQQMRTVLNGVDKKLLPVSKPSSSRVNRRVNRYLARSFYEKDQELEFIEREDSTGH